MSIVVNSVTLMKAAKHMNEDYFWRSTIDLGFMQTVQLKHSLT